MAEKAFSPPWAGLTADSRKVKPGFLFAALPGVKDDGRQFIPAAIQAGATHILAPSGTQLPPEAAGVTLIQDGNPRRCLALEAARFYGKQPPTIVAVTGANGKTSVVWFVQQLWAALGIKAACLGTVGLHGGGFDRDGNLTTPDPVTLHAILKEVAEAGVDHLALEASSHGLDQERLAAVRIAAGGFTNLTRDHLDYHGSMDAYFRAKSRLFEERIQEGGTAILNADTPQCASLSAIAARRRLRVLTYGAAGKDLVLRGITPVSGGQRLQLEILGRAHDLVLPLIGEVQVFNALCALGLVIGTGSDPALATEALSRLKSVRGRMEKVLTLPGGATVYVDYAHTPDGLETLLKGLRAHTQGHLVVVFGCGGDRDRGKRPVMGRIACT
ncbi:MAG: UDP-N-acetylmuramoyl-L-alanyl-D-glutamate--2,6-diaminopimelate ligase, partial [Pseudomonadota bacterium]|nr:UDP-N-acetylmuramoyl-L-alanyl-D-glutamate--2,6-diaminopimelate ligase [Pseudomonadota bacterium]